MKNQLPALLFISLFFYIVFISCKKENEITDLPSGNLPAKYIDIKDSAFFPASLITVAGTTIVFINNTASSRKLISHNSVFFDSAVINPGKFYTLKKDIDGTLEFHCSENPGSTGSITFTP